MKHINSLNAKLVKKTKVVKKKTEVVVNKKNVEVPISCFDDEIRAILRTNPGWSDEISRLSDKDLTLLGVRDPLASVEHVSLMPIMGPRKKDMSAEELASLEEMRTRRTGLITRVHSLVDTRLKRGFVCQDEDWLQLVKNLVVVAVVGAEGMRGSFDFKTWLIGVARTEGILDMNFVHSKGITNADFKLMLATCLYAFVMACRCVHLRVRQSDVIPSMQQGNLMHVMRVVFGTFWDTRYTRDADVLTLASMMVASTVTEHAVEMLPTFLVEIGIPHHEWPMCVLLHQFPRVLYLSSRVSSSPATAPEAATSTNA